MMSSSEERQRQCLLCWSLITPPTGNKEAVMSLCVEVAGAGDSELLKRQLNQWFILRKLLDIPTSWCENLLKANSRHGIEDDLDLEASAGEENLGNGLDSWFAVCADCHNHFVEEGWRVHQQILRLEGRMTEIKTQIKRSIKQNCFLHEGRGRPRRDWVCKEKIAVEIRKLAVPELEERLQSSSNVELDTLDLHEEPDEAPSELEDSLDHADEDWLPDNDPVGTSQNKLLTKLATPNGDLAASKVETEPGQKKPRNRKDRPRKIKFLCTLCNCRPFPSSADLQDHLQLHQQRQQVLDTGEDSPDDKLNCSECTYPARDPQELNAHIYNRHRMTKWRKMTSYKCPFCPKSLEKWSSLLYHISKRHKTATPEEITALKNAHLKCTQCDFLGTLPNHLVIHKRRVHPQPPSSPQASCHSCPTCGILFATAKELESHTYNTHFRASLFICDICGKGFPHRNYLENHKHVHTKHFQRDWICDVCGVDFPQRVQLNEHHQKYHSGETASDQVFKCRYCDLTSPFNAVIKRHLQTHKEQGEHRCDKCGKFYMNAQGLKRHLRINHLEGGEGAVPCPHCKKPFPSKDYMMTHLKKWCKLKTLNFVGVNQ